MNSYSSTQLASPSVHARSIVWDVVWTVLTFGLYNIYIQHVQMKAVNQILKEEKYRFLPWALFSLLTFGLYHIYHEYRMSVDLVRVCEGCDPNLPVLSVVLSGFGFWVVADAIQQTYINRYYGVNTL